MADYYPLIARSIEGIGDPTPEMRQSVYDRAKQALIEQLRLMDPPMPEIDIMRERLALESTVRKFERAFIAEQRRRATQSTIESTPDDTSPDPVNQDIPAENPITEFETAQFERNATVETSDAVSVQPEALPDTDPQSKQKLKFVRARIERVEEKTDEINLYVDNLENKQIILFKNLKNILENKYFYRFLLIIIVISGLSISVLKVAQFLETSQSTNDALNASGREEALVETGKKIDEKAPIIASDNLAPSSDQSVKGDNNANNANSIISEIEQRAIFLEEAASSNLEPVRFAGQVIWKLETYPSSVGGVSDTGARATITVKDISLTADIVIRQNKDQDSANSHMIEVKFTTGEQSARGKVRDIGVPELRSEENLRGAQLAGIPVPVTANVFLIGMNALPVESQKNLELLRKMNWILLPIRFQNGKRSALLFEKGKTGNRVIEDTIETWK